MRWERESSVFRINMAKQSTNPLSISGSAHLLSFTMFRSSFGLFGALLDAIYVTQNIKQNTSWRESCSLSPPIIFSGFSFLSGEPKTAQNTSLSFCLSFFFQIYLHCLSREVWCRGLRNLCSASNHASLWSVYLPHNLSLLCWRYYPLY